MKIVHIVSTYPPYYGGMGNTVFEMSSGLVGLGHKVLVLTPGVFEDKELKSKDSKPEKDHESNLQNRIDHAKRLKPSLQYGNAARLPQVKKDLKGYDIVHLHYPFFGTANLVRKFKLQNPDVPLVITYHMDTRAPSWKGLIFKYYNSYWMPKILGVADKLIASSLDYIESSQASGLYQTNKDKWIGLPFGVDIDRFKPRTKPESLFNRYNLDPEVSTLLFVGGMDAAHYFKGVPILLKALFLLKKQGVDVQAIFVGDGELQEDFRLQASGLGIDGRTMFVGYATDEELPQYYNMADLLVLPSTTMGEAFGMVLLEAMASGVPVVASDLPGVRTVAYDGGITFEPGNSEHLAEAIMGFFAKSENITDWSKRVRGIVEEKYSWDKIVGDLEGVYKGLLKK
jgi:glycosyltransferase involved in cell wall biosynthesis